MHTQNICRHTVCVFFCFFFCVYVCVCVYLCSFALLDLHSSVPPYHHTPWGLSSWQLDRSTLTASSGYGDQSTWHALRACFMAMRPAATHPRVFQAWAWPAHLYDNFLAYKTGLGPALRPYVRVCVYLCVCICACVCVYLCVCVHPCMHECRYMCGI